ncbi:single myb histone 1-like isoform X2 [Arachis stenosperma]|nr:single myb histone 1-like isoform X2 [Arachis stenosperma]
MTILNDPEFAPILSLRNNVSLKDKWRNLSNDAQGSTSGKPSELEALRAELKCLREELKQIKDERACLQKQVKDLTEEAAKYKELKSLLRMYLNG